MSKSLTVECPCCEARLVVDRNTGDVLSHRRRRRGGGATLQQRLADLDREARRRDLAFEKALRNTERRVELLDLKFEEARRESGEEE